MVNILGEGDNGLTRLDYSNLLANIVQVLTEQPLKNYLNLSPDGKQLVIDIDEIAAKVSALNCVNPLGAATFNTKCATLNLNLDSRQTFRAQIQQIRDILTQNIETSINSIPLQDFIKQLTTALTEFQGNSQKLDFTIRLIKDMRIYKKID